MHKNEAKSSEKIFDMKPNYSKEEVRNMKHCSAKQNLEWFSKARTLHVPSDPQLSSYLSIVELISQIRITVSTATSRLQEPHEAWKLASKRMNEMTSG